MSALELFAPLESPASYMSELGFFFFLRMAVATSSFAWIVV